MPITSRDVTSALIGALLLALFAFLYHYGEKSIIRDVIPSGLRKKNSNATNIPAFPIDIEFRSGNNTNNAMRSSDRPGINESKIKDQSTTPGVSIAISTYNTGPITPITPAQSHIELISDVEAKLKYLTLVYNEEVTDASYFDELDVIYRNTSSLPLHLIPCIVFAYGHDCRKFWKRKCDNGRHSSSSQDLTLLAETHKPTRKHTVGNNEWLEVTRWGTLEIPEGAGYGCFFNVRRGSGVFLNTGNTIVVQNDTDAIQKLGIVNATPGARYCPFARQMGFDTVQIVDSFDGNSPQVIYCTGSCATEPLTKACVPGLELRTGLRADKPCECDDSMTIINCGNTIAPKGKQHICDQKWFDADNDATNSNVLSLQVQGGGKNHLATGNILSF